MYELIKSNQIKSNLHIVLGNSNLRLTTPVKMRGERRGGAAQRLAKRGEEGEQGTVGRGKGGPEEIISGGNKGRQIAKNGRGRVEERGEPGVVASVQTGHLDLMT
jgi:hypothetical protein